ncbi:response regulator [Candidatus Saccharibacteria bacterium]|nr:response regulator [Candidatus Saccharibacteria bacterium]
MKQHILLIEPDKVLAKTYKAALGRAGYLVDWQLNAQDAITSVDSKHPVLIVLDVQLSGHNGVEFLYELRSYPDWQAIPVLILSAVTEAELGLSPETKKKLHIVQCLYEPHTKLAELIAVVRSLTSDTHE